MKEKASEEVRIAILGAGDRGSIYARFLSAQGASIVAIVDSDSVRARALQTNHAPEARLFSRWKDLLQNASSLGLDAVVIALPDQFHMEPAMEFSKREISVLLEKPVGLSVSELDRMQGHIKSMRKKENHALIMVCHVLRYSDFFGKIRTLIEHNRIGEVRSILHAENVSYFHFAHSYVRGNWGRSKQSSPVLLAKCSHDFDLIGWFAGSEFKSVQCSGELNTFLPEKAPAGATDRCLNGCPHSDCLFHAGSTYLDGLPLKRELARSRGWLSWMARISLRWPGLIRRLPYFRKLYPWPYWPTTTIVSGKVSQESVLVALKSGPYGRCVYTAGSDQPDHADTVIHFENGVTAIMRLNGNSYQEARTIRIEGSAGTLEGRFGQGGHLVLRLHGSSESEKIPVTVDQAGHLAEDRAISAEFLDQMRKLRTENRNTQQIVDWIQQADAILHQVMEGHRMALLAERSRATGRTIFR
ncbi:MAG: hypothetical protein CMN77_17025 [Spirochaetaceae bacterium]|mgnify:CR=1 FL=1|nr:hypothetical protein [Spirochaetaceae bacterium]|tara:strand:+ start:421 stop:1833 length:1413 start_codon:yes stop_codon:yes gene_type:complete